MSLPQTLLSYQKYIEAYDRAINSQTGMVRIEFGSIGEALMFRSRMHHARVLSRKENARVYPEDHQLHGQSPYDVLTVRDPVRIDGKVWLYVERNDVLPNKIEEVTEPRPTIEPSHEPVQIEVKAVPLLTFRRPL